MPPEPYHLTLGWKYLAMPIELRSVSSKALRPPKMKAFEDLHQQPWLIAFPDRKVKHLESLFAEDTLLAASGPKGVVATQTGPYLGHPPSGNPIEVSGIDFWRREGDQFVENWVFVDMIHLFAQMGVDLFARLPK